MIDKVYKNVGRIQKATGTTDPKVYAGIRAMLDMLYASGKLEILKEIQRGATTPLKVYSLMQGGKLTTSVTTVGFAALSDVKDYLENRADLGERTRYSYLSLYNVFITKYGENHSIEEIPILLEKFRAECVKKHQNKRQFNHTRAVFQGYCHNTKGLGRLSPLWIAITNVKPIRYQTKKKPALSVSDVLGLMAVMPKPIYADIIWTLATTGMRKSEYTEGLWKEKEDRIEIQGTKTDAAVRVIPKLYPIKVAVESIQRMEIYVRKEREKLGFDVSPHILRHTFAHWMESAGLPLSRRNLYMGHSATTMDNVYTHVEVERFLKDDRATVLKWIEREKVKAKKVKKAA
jgi:integrase